MAGHNPITRRARGKLKLRIAALLLSGHAGLAAADAVDLTVTVDGSSTSASFTSVEGALGVIGTATVDSYFSGYFAGYTDGSAAMASVSYLEVLTNYRFDAGSNTLHFEIPSIGFSRDFTSDTRQNSNRLLRDFLRDNGDQLLEQMERYRVENSPNSPVAGNPSSLQAAIVGQDFDNLGSDMPTPGSSGRVGGGATQIGFEAGSFSTGNLHGSNYTLPLSYTVAVGDRGHELRLSLPLTYTLLEGSEVYSGSFGATYRMPVGEHLSVQGGLTYGAVYSEDLLQVVQLGGASLGASYRFELGGARVMPALLLGYVTSLPFQVTRYAFDPDIESYTVKLGQIVENDLTLYGHPVRVQLFAANSRVLGQRFFIDSYTDLGFNVALLPPSGNKLLRRLKAGITATLAENYDAARLNFGYAF
ncbi:MAG: hypothetical protein Q8Q73_13900 [Stagnimonas sp.]|nr:hypothetical protein [Stagnimonas sp.]